MWSHARALTCVGAVEGPVVVGEVLDGGPEAVHHQTGQQEEEGKAEAEGDDEAIPKAWARAVHRFSVNRIQIHLLRKDDSAGWLRSLTGCIIMESCGIEMLVTSGFGQELTALFGSPKVLSQCPFYTLFPRLFQNFTHGLT